MIKRAYIAPMCICIPVDKIELLGTSVIPVGTQAGNGTDTSQENWNEEGKIIGGVGVGGDEFNGNDWQAATIKIHFTHNERRITLNGSWSKADKSKVN